MHRLSSNLSLVIFLPDLTCFGYHDIPATTQYESNVYVQSTSTCANIFAPDLGVKMRQHIY